MTDPRIDSAVVEIGRRMGDGITVAALARAANLSQSRFADLFHQQMGISPGRYLRQRRLDRARLLLQSTFLSVRQVMATVGFNDQSHFSRDFQRAFGVSPRAWRQHRPASDGQQPQADRTDPGKKAAPLRG